MRKFSYLCKFTISGKMRVENIKNVNNIMGSYFKILLFIILVCAICTKSASLNLSSLPSMIFNVNDSCSLSLNSVTPVTCFGSNDGTISVQVDSGSGMYHYYLEMYYSETLPNL